MWLGLGSDRLVARLGSLQAVAMARTRRSGLPKYKLVGKGYCRDSAGKYPRYYQKYNAFSTFSGCRSLCTALSVACVGYDFALSGSYTGQCGVYGSTLPDRGTGAAAPGKPLDEWNFFAGIGGSDTLIDVIGWTGYACQAKQPGASSTHPPMPSPHPPSTL